VAVAAAAAAIAAAKARSAQTPAPAPPPKPAPRKNFNSSPPSAAVVTAQGVADDKKKSTTIPGGIPVPEWAVPKSNLPKDPHFTSAEPYAFIQALLENAPAGLLASAISDSRDLAAAHLDENWVSTLVCTLTVDQ